MPPAGWLKQILAAVLSTFRRTAHALGVRNLLAYATSKAGVHGMTRQLAIELAEHGIRVNTFAPGPINVSRNLADDPDYRDAWGSVVPLRRTADPMKWLGRPLPGLG